jgi:hypothetical protein
MCWASILRKFGRSKVQLQSVRSGLEVHQSLEVGIVNGPLLGWEAVLVVPDRQLAIERLRRVGALSRDQEDLLVDLVCGQYVAWR